jgi:hypothetical protein
MNHYPIVHYGQMARPTANPYLEMGKIGAVVGLCGAGAANLRRLQREEVTRAEAAVDTLRTAVASGLATAAATLVAGQLRSSVLSLLASVATGTAVMYALNAETRANTTGGDA